MNKIKDFQHHLDVSYKGFTDKINSQVTPLMEKPGKKYSYLDKEEYCLPQCNSNNSNSYGNLHHTEHQIRNHIFNDMNNNMH